ncbi:MAG: hypothetical protein KIC67_18625 [Clostridium butyricum]|nr:hypothetical protein [Clostridium butyricum]
MYVVCKEQYERKVSKGTLTSSYVEKQKIYIGVFLQNEMLTLEQYQKVFDYLNEHDSEKNSKNTAQ